MPEVVLSRHGRYEFVQSGGGLELRERLDPRRRVRLAMGGALVGAAAIVWDRTRHPFAVAGVLLGGVLIASGLRTKRRRLAIYETEIVWGHTGDDPRRSSPWPRSRIAGIVVERGSRLADPKLRRRRPVWTVRIRGRDGELHPACFAFSSETTARALAETLARRLAVAIEVAESAAGAAPTPARPPSDLRGSPHTEPRPGRLDPR